MVVFSKKSERLFKLMDDLHEHKEELEHSFIRKKKNRLNHVEDNAKAIKEIAVEMQQIAKEMRRK